MKFFEKTRVCWHVRHNGFGSGDDFLPKPLTLLMDDAWDESTEERDPRRQAPEHRMRVVGEGEYLFPRSNSGEYSWRQVLLDVSESDWASGFSRPTTPPTGNARSIS